MARLTTTSYGVLALLAKQPWSAYDLTKEIRRSLSHCWPRADTGLYQEPKNLVAHGFARARAEANGRQNRTVYSITPAGRRALQAWFQLPCAPPLFESEAVVRVVFAENGSRDDLLSTLTQLEQQAVEMAQGRSCEVPAYVARIDPSAEHLHDLALVGDLFVDYYALLASWARRARTAVENRPVEWPPDEVSIALAALPTAFGASDLAVPDET